MEKLIKLNLSLNTKKEIFTSDQLQNNIWVKEWIYIEVNKNYGKKTSFDKTCSFDLFEKYGIENCRILLLELANARTKDELHTREAHYIKTLKCVNKVIPNRTRKDYYEDKKTFIYRFTFIAIFRAEKWRRNKIFYNACVW